MNKIREMEQAKIEELERENLRMLFWQTLGFIFMMTGVILGQIPVSGNVVAGFYLICALLSMLFIWATLKKRKIDRTIRRDKQLFAAIYNEVYRNYSHRALVYAFYATLLTIVVVYLIDDILVLPVKIYCLVFITIAGVVRNVCFLLLYK